MEISIHGYLSSDPLKPIFCMSEVGQMDQTLSRPGFPGAQMRISRRIRSQHNDPRCPTHAVHMMHRREVRAAAIISRILREPKMAQNGHFCKL